MRVHPLLGISKWTQKANGHPDPIYSVFSVSLQKEQFSNVKRFKLAKSNQIKKACKMCGNPHVWKHPGASTHRKSLTQKHPLQMQQLWIVAAITDTYIPRRPHPIEVDINSIEVNAIHLKLTSPVIRNLIHLKY